MHDRVGGNDFLLHGHIVMKDSSTPVLDRIDIRILRALQTEGRLTNAELAARVSVSPATCHRRTQRLFEEGIIAGVRAQIAPGAVGLGALVMVGVVLDRSTPESFAEFEGAVGEMKEVLDCNLVAGDFDYLLKVRTRDINAYRRVMGDQISGLPCVKQTHTYVVMEVVKDERSLPVRPTA